MNHLNTKRNCAEMLNRHCRKNRTIPEMLKFAQASWNMKMNMKCTQNKTCMPNEQFYSLFLQIIVYFTKRKLLLWRIPDSHRNHIDVTQWWLFGPSAAGWLFRGVGCVQLRIHMMMLVMRWWRLLHRTIGRITVVRYVHGSTDVAHLHITIWADGSRCGWCWR